MSFKISSNVELFTVIDINSKDPQTSLKEGFDSSIFRINDSDSEVVRDKLKKMLSDSKIPELAYSTIQVDSEKEHEFSGITGKTKAHFITLDIGFWHRLWLHLSANDSSKADSLVIEDFFKNIQDKKGRVEILKASNQGLKILLKLSKPSSQGFEFLECELPGSPIIGFSLTSLVKNGFRYVFSSDFERSKSLKKLRDISFYLIQFKQRGDTLAQAATKKDLANGKYQKVRLTVNGPKAYQKLQEATHHDVHIAEKMQETVHILFKIMNSSLDTTLILPFNWLYYTHAIDVELGKIVVDVFEKIRPDLKKNAVTNDKIFTDIKENVRKKLHPEDKASTLEKDFKVIFDQLKESFEGLDSIENEFNKLGIELISPDVR